MTRYDLPMTGPARKAVTRLQVTIAIDCQSVRAGRACYYPAEYVVTMIGGANVPLCTAHADPYRDCACCGMQDYRTADGDCTYCDGRQECCRN